MRKFHIFAMAIWASGCATYDRYEEPQSDQPHAILKFEEAGGPLSSRPWPMQLNGAWPANNHKRAFRIHTGAMRLQVADHLEGHLPFGPPSLPVHLCDVTFEALVGKLYAVSMMRESGDRSLFVVTDDAGIEVAKCRSITPDPIDRLMNRLDSSDAWKFDEFPGLDLSATATAEQLIAQLFGRDIVKDEGIERYEILMTRYRHIPLTSEDSYLVVLVDTNLGMKIALFTYRNPEEGWWNRSFDPIPPL
jgi:hypothetical protein